MIQSRASEAEAMNDARLPRWNWALLAMISMVTVVLLTAGTELALRKEHKLAEAGIAPCLDSSNPPTGERGVPNSQCRDRVFESAWVDYKFNSCGHRAGMECGPKSPGTYRIVIAGSSVAMGLHVQRDESIAALLPSELSRQSVRKVEVYNAAVGAEGGGTPRSVAARFDEILAAKPDMILWIMTPWDILHVSDLVYKAPHLQPVNNAAPAPAKRASILAKIESAATSASSLPTLYQKIERHVQLAMLLQHWLFESRSLYIRSYLMNGDSTAGFLKANWGAGWNAQIEQFDGYDAEIEKKASAVGVPVVTVLVPNRAQAAMISTGQWPAAYDPFKLGREVGSVVPRHGGTYVNILPEFRNIPDPEVHYFPVDGHLDAQGQVMISTLLAKALTSGAVPALEPAARSQVSIARTR